LALKKPASEDCSAALAGTAKASEAATTTRQRKARDTSDPQVGSEDVLVVELGRFGHELDAALLQDVDVVGQLQGPADVLLDEEQGGPLRGDLVEVVEDLVDELGGEAERHLVDEDELGPGQPGVGQGQHLLLAAAQRAGPLVEALAEDRERLGGPRHRFLVE